MSFILLLHVVNPIINCYVCCRQSSFKGIINKKKCFWKFTFIFIISETLFSFHLIAYFCLKNFLIILPANWHCKMNYFSFCLSGSLYFVFIFESIFTVYSIDIFFSFSVLKMSFFCLTACIVFEISAIIFICISLHTIFFFSCWRQVTLFSLVSAFWL